MAAIESIGGGTAFEPGERRQVDVGGRTVSLELIRVEATGRRRHFVARDAEVRIQINGGDPADDEARIRRVTGASGSVGI